MISNYGYSFMTSFRPTNDLKQPYTVQQRAYEQNENVMSHPDDFSKTSMIQSPYLARSPYCYSDANLLYCQLRTLFRQRIVILRRPRVTAAIPITPFWGKVLAHNANSIAASKALLMIESNLMQTRKIGLIM